jgi:hypothetical protein
MRQTAFRLAVVAMLSWGLWVVFARVAGEPLTGEVIVVITYLVGGAVGVGYLLLRGTVPALTGASVGYAVASGPAPGSAGWRTTRRSGRVPQRRRRQLRRCTSSWPRSWRSCSSGSPFESGTASGSGWASVRCSC